MARHALVAVSIAFASLGTAAVAQAQTRATIVVQAGSPQHYGYAAPVPVQYGAPSPPRYEAVPHARRGMAWVPGHWEWRGHRHVWMSGYWVKARPGHHYRAHQWQERDGRWYAEPGRWDRDGDGVANRHDRDRDGDGIRNRNDRRPDNPYRY